MIDDADRSLAAWLGRFMPPGTAIKFDAPEPAWARRAPAEPFADLLLYDIAEDIAGLPADSALLRDPDGRATARRPPARRYRLSYLVTAWTADVSAGHELLGAVLAGCAGAAAVIPPDFLRGTLKDAGLPVPVECAPPREEAAQPSPAGLCQALGIPPRAALILVLTAPLVPAAGTELAPPARRLDLELAETAPAASGRPRPPRRRWERVRITERRESPRR